MSFFSIQLPQKLLEETDRRAKSLHISRAKYIRKAIELMNKEMLIDEKKKNLAKISLLVRKESMRVCKEFDLL